MLRRPRGQAIGAMASASALHFAAYELARTSVVSIFTSHKKGFSSSAALPVATGCISPFSLALLWLYTRVLEQHGPRMAIRASSLLCALTFGAGGIIMHANQVDAGEGTILSPMQHFACKWASFFLFVAQNGFVQLIYTQHWSFLGSIQADAGKGDKNSKGAKEQLSKSGSKSRSSSSWFAPVAGIGSISSTLTAYSVTNLVDRTGLAGLLEVAALMILCSCLFAELAYSVSERHGFEPHQEQKRSKDQGVFDTVDGKKSQSLVQRALSLFRRVPVLGALCAEVLICQCVSSLVHFLFVLKMKDRFTDDQEKAGWSGKIYACINGSGGLLQFVLVPLLVQCFDLERLWPLMPSVILALVLYMAYKVDGSHQLEISAAVFGCMKVFEYSLRAVCNEMIYTDLDYESRFVGKEVIGLFANRFGKSGTAVGLSVLTTVFPSPKSVDRILCFSLVIFSVAWLAASFRLVDLLFTGSSKSMRKSKSD